MGLFGGGLDFLGNTLGNVGEGLSGFFNAIGNIGGTANRDAVEARNSLIEAKREREKQQKEELFQLESIDIRGSNAAATRSRTGRAGVNTFLEDDPFSGDLLGL